jgi:hypothetical protein
MDLDEARHVLTNTARINEGGYVADCRDRVLAELDDQPPAATAEGYVIAGPDVPTSKKAGQLVSDWDGEVHLTREDGDVALAECRRAGYADWQLYALVRVSE